MKLKRKRKSNGNKERGNRMEERKDRYQMRRTDTNTKRGKIKEEGREQKIKAVGIVWKKKEGSKMRKVGQLRKRVESAENRKKRLSRMLESVVAERRKKKRE